MHAKGIIMLLLIVTGMTGIILYWNIVRIDSEIAPILVTHHAQAQSLGGTIYEKGSNPVSNKLPGTNPVGDVNNPFESYKNPFDQWNQNIALK